MHRLGPLNTAWEGDTRPHSPGTIGVVADEGSQFSRTSLPHPTQPPSPVQPPAPCRVPGPGFVRRPVSSRVYGVGSVRAGGGLYGVVVGVFLVRV